MLIIYIIVTIMTAAASAFAAVVDFRHPQWVVDNITRWGGSESWPFTLGALKVAGALGLMIGIGVPLVGVAAATGMVLFLVGAIAVMTRVRWYSHLPGLRRTSSLLWLRWHYDCRCLENSRSNGFPAVMPDSAAAQVAVPCQCAKEFWENVEMRRRQTSAL